MFIGANCSVALTVPWRLLFRGAYCSTSPKFPPIWYCVTLISTDLIMRYLNLHRNFVETNIFALPIFFLRRYFAASDILSKPIFLQNRYFFFADILSTQIFFLRQNFVEKDILYTVINKILSLQFYNFHVWHIFYT